MKRPSVPLPNKTELFCWSCQKWHPRANIAAVKLIQGGLQAQYLCRACKVAYDAGRGPHCGG